MEKRMLPLRLSRDVITARELVRKMAQETGFGLANQTRLATAVSEIARNAVTHGRGGEMAISVKTAPKKSIIVLITDRGPGIPDIKLAMQNGWSSTGSLGEGLPGARRLVNSFHLESNPGQGTTVTMEVRQ